MLLITKWFARAPSRLYGYLLLLPIATVPLTIGLALWFQTGPPSLHIDPANGRYLRDPFWPLLMAPGLLNLLPWLIAWAPGKPAAALRFHARLAGALGILRLLAPIIVWALKTPPATMPACPNLEPCGLNPLLWAIGVSSALWAITFLCWLVALVRE